ncbi:MAG: RnfH family protein [Acidiferrobacterales bacterium]
MASATGRSDSIVVEVAYATPSTQVIFTVQLQRAATVEQAIRQSGVLQAFPEIDLSVNAVGIFGERVHLDHGLKHGDRVEIYRGLTVDPKRMRKRRAHVAKREKRER